MLVSTKYQDGHVMFGYCTADSQTKSLFVADETAHFLLLVSDFSDTSVWITSLLLQTLHIFSTVLVKNEESS